MGEITVCTIEGEAGRLPPEEAVEDMISRADLILLDQELGADYTGDDLLSACLGKFVIGISPDYQLSISWFQHKDNVSEPEHRTELRTLVQAVLEEHQKERFV